MISSIFFSLAVFLLALPYSTFAFPKVSSEVVHRWIVSGKQPAGQAWGITLTDTSGNVALNLNVLCTTSSEAKVVFNHFPQSLVASGQLSSPETEEVVDVCDDIGRSSTKSTSLTLDLTAYAILVYANDDLIYRFALHFPAADLSPKSRVEIVNAQAMTLLKNVVVRQEPTTSFSAFFSNNCYNASLASQLRVPFPFDFRGRSFSIQFWIKLTELSRYKCTAANAQNIISRLGGLEGTGSASFKLAAQEPLSATTFSVGSTQCAIANSFNFLKQGRWHLVTLVGSRPSNSLVYYIDGVQRASTIGLPEVFGPLSLGADLTSKLSSFEGLITDFRIWRRDLRPDEVAQFARYNAKMGFYPSDNSMELALDFSDSTQLGKDSSGKNRHADVVLNIMPSVDHPFDLSLLSKEMKNLRESRSSISESIANEKVRRDAEMSRIENVKQKTLMDVNVGAKNRVFQAQQEGRTKIFDAAEKEAAVTSQDERKYLELMDELENTYTNRIADMKRKASEQKDRLEKDAESIREQIEQIRTSKVVREQQLRQRLTKLQEQDATALQIAEQKLKKAKAEAEKRRTNLESRLDELGRQANQLQMEFQAKRTKLVQDSSKELEQIQRDTNEQSKQIRDAAERERQELMRSGQAAMDKAQEALKAAKLDEEAAARKKRTIERETKMLQQLTDETNKQVKETRSKYGDQIAEMDHSLNMQLGELSALRSKVESQIASLNERIANLGREIIKQDEKLTSSALRHQATLEQQKDLLNDSVEQEEVRLAELISQNNAQKARVQTQLESQMAQAQQDYDRDLDTLEGRLHSARSQAEASLQLADQTLQLFNDRRDGAVKVAEKLLQNAMESPVTTVEAEGQTMHPAPLPDQYSMIPSKALMHLALADKYTRLSKAQKHNVLAA